MTPREDRIRIVPYDSRWPGLFAAQRERVSSALAGYLVGPVEHIGSTAVPGLPAKPIIDMLARIESYSAAYDAVIAALAGVEWVHTPEPSDAADRKLSFCWPDAAYRSHHLHVVEHGSAGWPTWIAFRDHLRAHPADAKAYGALKAELARLDDADRPRYRAGKAPFIQDVLRRI